mmetsp:Transcript_43260/g.67511  ORF Transcript_43260/g.67511 Transcript_43260/m.67511 type:complete len:531 (+) Transcript_43260:71-1663(+)
MGCNSSKALAAAPVSNTLLSAPANEAEKEVSKTAFVENHGCASSLGHADVLPSLPQNYSNASNAMLKRALTLVSDKHELDVFVSQFTSHDSTMGSVIGRNSKEVMWKVIYDRDAKPLDIKMHVQEHKLHYHDVGIECDGQSLLAGAGSSVAKVKEDFSYKWPFRGNVFGVNEVNFFEMRPAHLAGDTWYPATITKANVNGTFQADVMEPDGPGALRKVPYPAVDRENLREAGTRRPLEVPTNSLSLFVPMKDPIHATLSLENGSLVTHNFGRLSPAPTGEKRQLNFTVARDRSSVKANVGHAELAHFCSGQVRTVKNDVQRLSRLWSFQLGPFGLHTVEVSKRYTAGSVMTLSVDGEVFVEATAAEIGCKGEDWKCEFTFFGERCLNFEVYKTNKDGQPTNETGTVIERRRYTHKCIVIIPDKMDFRTANLFIDNRLYHDHEPAPPKHDEPNVEMSPHALQSTYSIVVPYKVDPMAPSSLALFTTGVSSAVKDAANTFSCFTMCCGDKDIRETDKHEVVESETVFAPGTN